MGPPDETDANQTKMIPKVSCHKLRMKPRGCDGDENGIAKTIVISLPGNDEYKKE